MIKISLSKVFFIFFFTSLVFFLSLISISTKVYADVVLFEDNFDNKSLDKWKIRLGSGGEIWFEDGEDYEGDRELMVKAVKQGLDDPTHIYQFTDWTNYRLEVKLKGEVGVDKTILFRMSPTPGAYQLKLLDSSYSAVNNLMLLKGGRGVIASATFPNSNGIWYCIRVDLLGSEIKIYIDDMNTPKLEYNDPSPSLVGGIALMAWTGAYAGEGSLTINRFDDVVVTTLPTSSPSPTPSLNPIVLLPGLGAGWNHGAMISGDTKPPEEWYMTPFVKAYDGLIQTLKNAEYEDTEPDRNLFIFNYDWRQPIETIANQLNDYIENTVDPPAETKIDLIGHSLGGMVARTYVQNNPDHQVDQLISIGSPHKGAPKVYYLWEGADLKRVLEPWQRIGTGILLHLNKKDYQNNVETIRAMVPVLRDLMPTFSYLRHDGVEKPLSEMEQRNEWLESLNQLPLPEFLISSLNTIVGVIENSTLRWINVEERNRFDQFLGKWEDGRPVGEEFDSGDKTVLVESAQMKGVDVIELTGLNHGDLVETTVGQEAIIDLLGLSPSEFGAVEEVIYEPSLVFQIASSANITVFGPDDTELASGQELVFIPNAEEGDYIAQVNPKNSGGPYRLLVGKITKEGDSWTELSGEVTTEPKDHPISFATDSQQNKLELLNEAKESLEDAKNLAKKLTKPLSILLVKAIEKRIRQVEEIIAFLDKNKENQAQIKTRQAIFSISILEKNLQVWKRILGPLPKIQNELRIARDYLLQVYEFE